MKTAKESTLKKLTFQTSQLFYTINIDTT